MTPLAVTQLPLQGSLEDALRGRAPESGSQPVKLDWQDRLRIAQHLAEGLLELHSAPPRLLHGGLRPASVLLTEAGEAQLAPPSLASVAFGAQVGGIVPTLHLMCKDAYFRL